MEKRNYIQIINELEEARGGNGGNIFMINGFLDYIDSITDEELVVLDAYSDSLKRIVSYMMDKRLLSRTK